MRRPTVVRLQPGERARLAELVRAGGAPRVVRRARIVLRAAAGVSNVAIARELGTDPGTVAVWRNRFSAQRLPGLLREAPRTGRPPALSPARVREIVRMTLGRRPDGRTHWTAELLAREVGVSKSTIQRIWRAHQIEPRRAAETLRRDPGPAFVEKVTDLVGVYSDPPDRAMAFSVGDAGRPSSLPPLAGRSVARAEEERRALEFRAFLQRIDRETPDGLDVHLLLDARLAPRRPEVSRWLAHHPRFYLHFLPAESSRPNLIDRWWSGFARSRLRTGASPGAVRLHRAFVDRFGQAGSRAFVWTASADEIRGVLVRRPRVPRRRPTGARVRRGS